MKTPEPEEDDDKGTFSNINISMESSLADTLRAEAERQKRPLSWVIREFIQIGMKRAKS